HSISLSSLYFSFNAPSPTDIYPLSLHDALPIWFYEVFQNRFYNSCLYASLGNASPRSASPRGTPGIRHIHRKLFLPTYGGCLVRSEEHTSELQSRFDLVCRLLLEKKKKQKT